MSEPRKLTAAERLQRLQEIRAEIHLLSQEMAALLPELAREPAPEQPAKERDREQKG